MGRKILTLLSLALVIAVVLSGCISTEPWPYYPGGAKKYDGVNIHFDMNYTEIERIDMNEAEPKLNETGFLVERTPNPHGLAVRNWSQYRQSVPELSIFISGQETVGSQSALFDVTYRPSTPSRDDITERNNITNYLKMRANEVATICNITLDWDIARWGWNVEP